jgi:hypothetical protein
MIVVAAVSSSTRTSLRFLLDRSKRQRRNQLRWKRGSHAFRFERTSSLGYSLLWTPGPAGVPGPTCEEDLPKEGKGWVRFSSVRLGRGRKVEVELRSIVRKSGVRCFDYAEPTRLVRPLQSTLTTDRTTEFEGQRRARRWCAFGAFLHHFLARCTSFAWSLSDVSDEET